LVRLPGGGWPSGEQISLRDIDDALGAEATLAPHRNEPRPTCRSRAASDPPPTSVYARVDGAVRLELAHTSLADVLRDTLTS
jgi:hypothetical protein